MKMLFVLLGLACGTVAAGWSGDNYDELWKKAEKAMAEDRPQLAVSYLKEIETKAIADGDTLELFDARQVLCKNLYSYNWKEYNAYSELCSELQDALYENIDRSIEKYSHHPRLDILLIEKYRRMKREEDRKDTHLADSYLKIRQLCEQAVTEYNNPRRKRSFETLISEMDSKSMDVRCKGTFAPGTKQMFELTVKNLDKVNIDVFRLGDSSSVLYRSVEVSNLKNEYNIRETSLAEIAFPEAGIYNIRFANGDVVVSKTLYVSRVAVGVREIGSGWQIYVADAVSGKPYPNANVTAVTDSEDWRIGKAISSCDYNLDGFTDIKQKLFLAEDHSNLIVSAGGDKYSLPITVWKSYKYGRDTDYGVRTRKGMEIFTDRKLYRPEDTIRFKILAYKVKGNVGEVLSDQNVEVTLFSPEGKAIGSPIKLKTNDMGTASGSFSIPKGSKNGVYSIRSDHSWQTVRVEEYSVPDFYIETSEQNGIYAFNDIVSARGVVKGYAGNAVAGAEITYKVTMHPNFDRLGSYVYFVPQNVAEGKIDCDAAGNFEIDFAAVRPETEADNPISACYEIEIRGSNNVGGVCEEKMRIFAGDEPVLLNAAFEKIYIQDSVKLIDRKYNKGFTLEAKNLAGAKVDIDISYSLSRNGKIIKKGKSAAGKFVNIGFEDMRPGEYELKYSVSWRGRKISGNTRFALFSIEDRIVPVSRDLFFYPVEGKGIGFMVGTSCPDLYVEVEVIDRDKILHRMPLHLKNESRYIEFPYKDSYNDAVMLSVFGFRNGETVSLEKEYSRPAAKTNFELKIRSFRDCTTPRTHETFQVEGPAGAELVVSIFDVTADRYGANSFCFSPFSRYYTYSPSVKVNLRDKIFGHADNFARFDLSSKNITDLLGVREESSSNAALSKIAPVSGIYATSVADAVEEESEVIGLREDFGQTLAFIPHLKIGKEGSATVDYVTSDALSTFRVMVFGHLADLHNSYAEKSFIVSKDLVLTCNLPQFVTEGDKIVFRANVANMSGNALFGKAFLEVYNAETGTKINGEKTALELLPKSQGNVAWNFTVPDKVNRLDVRIGYSADGLSDGERHFIEVVPAATEITETIAFIIGGNMTREQAEKEMKRRFGKFSGSMEYKEYSALSAVKASLQNIGKPENKNVISWIEYLWLNSVRCCLDKSSPAIDVKAAAENIEAAQNGDGGFGWFPQMSSSDLLTLLFLDKVAQLKELGINDMEPLDGAVKKAVSYIDRKIEEIAAKKEYGNLIACFAVRLDYKKIPMSDKVSKALESCIAWIENNWKNTTILKKGQMCRILLDCRDSYGYSDIDCTLDSLVVSLRDYAVTNSTIGCYFPNAVMPFRGLMHTEIYAHSILLDVFARIGDKKMVGGLSQWLMLQKHNQAWENNLATCDAVYAIMKNKAEDVKFGAVYYTYTAPMISLEETGTGMSVKRTFYRDGKVLCDGDLLHKGDKICVTYEVENDENRSFVVMKAMRPACFYPADERSRASWQYYYEQKFSCSIYYFQLLAEGDTSYSEEFFVTQDGVFNAGIVEIESLYATEYGSHTGARIVDSQN